MSTGKTTQSLNSSEDKYDGYEMYLKVLAKKKMEGGQIKQFLNSINIKTNPRDKLWLTMNFFIISEY